MGAGQATESAVPELRIACDVARDARGWTVCATEDRDLGAIIDALGWLRAQFAGIAFAAAGVDDVPELAPPEVEIAAHFTSRRREQFARGRGAARAALQQVGAPCLPIRSSPDGVPLFPGGFAGSISHKESWAIAVAASTSSIRSVGVDLELDDDRDEDDLLDRVCTLHERALLAPLQHAGHRSPGTWLHSAKEAAYKALFVRDGVRFDFEDIELAADVEHRTFRIVRLLGASCPRLYGRYARVGGWLVCAALLET